MIIAKKIQDGGFYDGDLSQLSDIDMDTGQLIKRKKIINEKDEKKILITTDDKNNLSSNLLKDLEKLKQLFEDGWLTEEEFKKAKEKLLN